MEPASNSLPSCHSSMLNFEQILLSRLEMALQVLICLHLDPFNSSLSSSLKIPVWLEASAASFTKLKAASSHSPEALFEAALSTIYSPSSSLHSPAKPSSHSAGKHWCHLILVQT